ncbi:MAG: S24/S26 family peptidase [Prevotella sp.]|nr:S24/S26 family peptidase [Prevotella sp.]
MTDEAIIQEAIKLVNEGLSVTFPVRGRSMLPFIIGGRESVILEHPSSVKVGDVVLAWVEGSRYVVHRVISIQGNRLTLMGDGNIAGTERCLKDDVKALATHVVNAKGQRHPLDSPWRKRWARLWFALRPVRRYLLYIYRKVKGIK